MLFTGRLYKSGSASGGSLSLTSTGRLLPERRGERTVRHARGNARLYPLNCRASFQINAFLGLQAAVENGLDCNYRVFASGTNAPGRNFVVTLRGKF